MVLIKMSKKRTLSDIIFEENLKMDKVDKWYIDVKRIKRKDNKVMSLNTILRKDVDTWVNIYKKEGWEIKDEK